MQLSCEYRNTATISLFMGTPGAESVPGYGKRLKPPVRVDVLKYDNEGRIIKKYINVIILFAPHFRIMMEMIVYK